MKATCRNTIKKIFHDPGTSFLLSDLFLFAQIPNRGAAIASVLLSSYLLLRSVATGRFAELIDKIDKGFKTPFALIYPHIPYLNKIPVEEFSKSKPGSMLLTIGVAQLPVFAVSLVVAALQPCNLCGWMAAAATGAYAFSNLEFGLHRNHLKHAHAHKTWKDVVTSPHFLVAAGSGFSGILAGLATSFGALAIIPIVAALISSAFLSLGKIGHLRLNKGLPLGGLCGVALLNSAVGAMNGNWFAALQGFFAANGDLRLAKFDHGAYQQIKPFKRCCSFWGHMMHNVYHYAVPDSLAHFSAAHRENVPRRLR